MRHSSGVSLTIITCGLAAGLERPWRWVERSVRSAASLTAAMLFSAASSCPSWLSSSVSSWVATASSSMRLVGAINHRFDRQEFGVAILAGRRCTEVIGRVLGIKTVDHAIDRRRIGLDRFVVAGIGHLGHRLLGAVRWFMRGILLVVRGGGCGGLVWFGLPGAVGCSAESLRLSAVVSSCESAMNESCRGVAASMAVGVMCALGSARCGWVTMITTRHMRVLCA